ncbi:MAG: hypothetical protein KDI19_05140 [Pseudomonadales bacterium]|nr:hypothetical protein [Pseudomonadales bacterium]
MTKRVLGWILAIALAGASPVALAMPCSHDVPPKRAAMATMVEMDQHCHGVKQTGKAQSERTSTHDRACCAGGCACAIGVMVVGTAVVATAATIDNELTIADDHRQPVTQIENPFRPPSSRFAG